MTPDTAWASVKCKMLATPVSLGPYLIKGQLGRGGMGVVYQGEHTGTGQVAAIKTVVDIDAEVVAAFRREVFALSRVEHPGVIRVFGQSEEDGRPWYAMELCEGPTLKSHTETRWQTAASVEDISDSATARQALGATVDVDAETGFAQLFDEDPRLQPSREAAGGRLTDALTMAWRLCHPLAYIHGEGIVHRDLKPENIFLRPDGSPVLADFGLASRSGGGREVLEIDTKVRGTVPYMAPEQLRGHRPDARCDLYALGCMLYEMLVDHPPFTGTPWMVMGQHLRATPTAPSELVTGVPPELDALILRLLAKEPQDRIGYADDVAAALEALGARTEGDIGPRPKSYLYRPRIVGRADVLARSRPAIDAVLDGRGSCIAIGGESGVGKTRVAVAIGSSAERDSVRVVAGECHDLSARAQEGAAFRDAPLHPLRNLLLAIGDRCNELGCEEADRLLGNRGPVLAAYEPALSKCPGQGAYGPPPRLPPDEARTRLFTYLERTLAAYAEAGPLLLVLDDIQWADGLTLAFLRFVLPRLHQHPVMLLCTYRAEDEGVVEDLLAAPNVTDIRLSRLDEASVGMMVDDMLGLREVPPEFVAFLCAESEGNPFFVAEYLRTAVAQGLLLRNEDRRWQLAESEMGEVVYADLPLPNSLHALFGLRLGGLDAGARHMVEVASVLGRQFDTSLLLMCCALDEYAGLAAQADLIRRQILEPGDAGQLRFLHDKMRETAYAEVAPERRRALHTEAAESIELVWSHEADRPRYHADLGHHWAAAREPARASTHFNRAGELAAAIYANDQAILYYRRALAEASACTVHDTLPTALQPETLRTLHERIADLLAHTGQDEAAREAYAAALEVALDAVVRARLYRKTGKTYETHRQHDEALAAYETAEMALEGSARDEQARRTEWIQIHVRKAWLAYWAGDVAEMQDTIEALRPAVESHATAAQRAQFYNVVCNYHHRRDRFRTQDETLEFARIALDAAQTSGDLAEISWNRFDFGFTLLFHGDLKEALSVLDRALVESERIGLLSQRIRCLAYLMVAARRTADVALTERYATQCLEVAEAGQMADYVAAARANLAWIAWRRGDTLAAKANAGHAREHWRKPEAAGYPFQWMVLLCELAMRVDDADLRGVSALVSALLGKTQQLLPDELSTPLKRFRACWAQGNQAEAITTARTCVETATALRYL